MADNPAKKNRLKALGKLGIFMGRVKSAPKLEPVLDKIAEKIKILKNQRELRCAHGRDNAAELLRNRHYELAFYRADYVLREQNMLQMIVIAERYCNLLIAGCETLKYQRTMCPEDLKEAISSLIFCSSRFDDFSELQQLASIFEGKFGSEFSASVVEAQSSTRVNAQMIEGLSEYKPTCDHIIRMMKDLSLQKGIEMSLEALEKILQEKPRDQEEEEGEDEENNQPAPACSTPSPINSQVCNQRATTSTQVGRSYETNALGDETYEINRNTAMGFALDTEVKRKESMEQRPSLITRLRKQKSVSLPARSDRYETRSSQGYLSNSKSTIVRGGSKDGCDVNDDSKEDWYVQGNQRLLVLRRKRGHSLQVFQGGVLEEVSDNEE